MTSITTLMEYFWLAVTFSCPSYSEQATFSQYTHISTMFTMCTRIHTVHTHRLVVDTMCTMCTRIHTTRIIINQTVSFSNSTCVRRSTFLLFFCTAALLRLKRVNAEREATRMQGMACVKTKSK